MDYIMPKIKAGLYYPILLVYLWITSASRARTGTAAHIRVTYGLMVFNVCLSVVLRSAVADFRSAGRSSSILRPRLAFWRSITSTLFRMMLAHSVSDAVFD
jgi:hypothetical protein